MAFTIVYAHAFDGPNLYLPVPGVALAVFSAADQQQQISAYLKQFAVRVGIVLGQLRTSISVHPQGMLTELHCATPTPQVALDLACLAVTASFADDQDDHALEEALWQAQQQQRAEALPVWAVQLLADARKRNIPAFRWQHGLQLGYGIRGMYVPVDTGATLDGLIMPDQIDIRGLEARRERPEQIIDWARLGTVPLLAISGGTVAQRQAIVQQLRSVVDISDGSYKLLMEGSFEDLRGLLAAPHTQAALLTLDGDMLLRRGLAFEQCRASVILSPDAEQANTHISIEDRLRVIGLPLLVTEARGQALLKLAAWERELLQEHAVCEIISGNQSVEVLLKTMF